jgi:hypothetical protein
MKIVEVLQERSYALIWAGVSITTLIGFPLLQIYATGGLQNYDVWLATLPTLNLVLFSIFAVLFGALLSFQMYTFKHPSCKLVTGGSASGGVGAVLAFLVPACPACLSVATFILPAASVAGFANFMSHYSAHLLGLSIALIFLGIYLLGGFRTDT